MGGRAALWLGFSRAVSGRVPVGSAGDGLRGVGIAAGWCEAPIDRHRSRRLPAVVGFPALDLLPACLDGHLCGRLLELPLELGELLLDGLRLAGWLQLSNRLEHLTESQNVVCAHLALIPSDCPDDGGHRWAPDPF